MTSSILDSVKKTVGLESDYTAFDVDILMHINSVFATLSQLGIGPDEGFSIDDNVPTWDSYLGSDKNLNFVKSYVYIKVRLMFDPPQTSFQLEALNKVATELEWRLNVVREETEWTDPTIEEVV